MKKTYTRVGPNQKNTPQMEPVPGKNQVQNNAGGYVFALEPFQMLERFLIMGTEGNTYYVTERKQTTAALACVEACLAADPKRAVQMAVDVSQSGRAFKNTPALVVIAAASGLGGATPTPEQIEIRNMALRNMHKVARYATQLFEFVQLAAQFRGWGQGMQTAVQEWYQCKTAMTVAQQVTKYPSRITEEGSAASRWSHSDLLRRARPKPDSPAKNLVYRYALTGKLPLTLEAPTGTVKAPPSSLKTPPGKESPLCVVRDDLSQHVAELSEVHEYLSAINEAKQLGKEADKLVPLIEKFKLQREHLPTEALNSQKVWEALLPNMGPWALVRNLAKLTAVGLIAPLSEGMKTVRDKLSDGEALRKARLHPLTVLIGQRQYAMGRGTKGSLTWQPVPQIGEALENAFYACFKMLPPTGLNHLLALDISGSMTMGACAGAPLRPCEGTAVLAMVLARVEKNSHIMGFGHSFVDLGVTASDTLAGAMKKVSDLAFGSTDCSLPMTWALQNKVPVDVFVTMTDNETWAGKHGHPFQRLTEYRNKMGRNSKNIVCGMTVTNFTIADPKDPNSLDVCGFDANFPSLVTAFAKGAQPDVGAAVEASDSEE